MKKVYLSIKHLDTYVNLKWLLDHFDATIRFNLMTRKREILLPNIFISAEDEDNAALAKVIYLATINDMPIRSIDSHLDVIALENSYHPIVRCIEEEPWDGISRLDDFIKTIEAEEPETAYKIIFTWMVAAIAAAHSAHGFIMQGVLVLQGSQKIGKTSFVRSLDPINCNAIKEGSFIDPTEKDSIAQLAGYWISELAELECIFNKSAMGRLKSFITMSFDYVRLPYARKATKLVRRSAYIATVNEARFLMDETGNRRWWTVAVKSINLNHGINMQQVWAEVYNYYWIDGAATDLSVYDQLSVNNSNKKHEKINPIEEKILVSYDWDSDRWRRLTVTQVMEEIGYYPPSHKDCISAGIILTKINGEQSTSTNG